MPYHEHLAERVRVHLKRRKGYSEKKMFGGICFMFGGNMCCGVVHDDLMLRIGAEAAVVALKKPHTREMDFTGRVMKNMIFVEPAGYRTEAALTQWVDQAADFAAALPIKKGKQRKS